MQKRVGILVLAILFLPNAARGEEVGREVLWKNIGFGAVLFLPAMYSQLFIHESAHAVAVKATGGEVKEFYIASNRYYGHVIGYWAQKPSESVIVFMDISPKIANILLFSVSELLFSAGVVENNSYLGAALFVFGELAPWIDFTLGLGIANSGDMESLEKATGLHPSFTRTIGAVVSGIGFYFLFERAKKVFIKVRAHPAKQAVVRKRTSLAERCSFGFTKSGVSFGIRF